MSHACSALGSEEVVASKRGARRAEAVAPRDGTTASYGYKSHRVVETDNRRKKLRLSQSRFL